MFKPIFSPHSTDSIQPELKPSIPEFSIQQLQYEELAASISALSQSFEAFAQHVNGSLSRLNNRVGKIDNELLSIRSDMITIALKMEEKNNKASP